MKYEDFVTQVQEQIRFHLPEEFADADITIKQIIKNNDRVMDALIIRKGKSDTIPVIYLDPFYRYLQKGATMDSALEMIADAFQAGNSISHDIDRFSFTAYENVRDRIVCKLINAETNKQFLQDKPYTKIADLAVIYQILGPGNFRNDAVITITNSLMDHYKITIEELHDQAIQNMNLLQPPSFMNMEQALAGILETDMPEEADFTAPVPPMFVLTNNIKVNGAAAILNDSTRQMIAGRIGGDYYILPSSTHEVLIIPKDETADFKALEQMVRSVNREMVPAGDFLSDHVYEYDSWNHNFFMASAGTRKEEGTAFETT